MLNQMKIKKTYIDATNLYGFSMSQFLPYDEIEMWHGSPDKYWNWLDEILNTPDDSEIGYFLEVDLKYPDNIKQKTKYFPFCPENKKIDPNKYNDYMNTIKPENYTKSKKLICDWTDKKNYLVHYRMLKFYVRHGMVVEKNHEIISFKQSRWLESYISFNTQKRNKAKNDFEKDFFKFLVNAAFGKFLENIRNRLNLELIKKDNIKKIVDQQSKLTFNGIQKTYENYYSFTYKKNEIIMDKAIYVGFAILELSKLHMYETYYDILQPYFGHENLQLHYMDSVTKDTPILLKEIENIKILRIDEIVDEEKWYVNDNIVTSWGHKEIADCDNIQIWMSNGWQNIKRLVRHKTEKNIYRIRTKHGVVDVTEDHSLIGVDREIIKPCDLEIGEELLHNFMNFNEPQITYDEIINKIYKIEPETLREKEMFVKGFFLGDGSSGIYKYNIIKYCWYLSNLDFTLIQKLQRFCKDIWNDINFKIYDVRSSSQTYRLASGRKYLALEFDKFYTKDKEKRIPNEILNESLENRKWFFIGFYAADGHKKHKYKNISFTQKHKITMSGLNYLCQSLGLKTCIGIRDDKFNVFHLNTVNNISDNKVHKIINIGKQDNYVYDIETETHDFNCGFPLLVHNTDSFVLSVITKDIIKDLKNLDNIFDFSNLDENHELYSNRNKKVIGKFKLETPKNIWIDEFVCLRSKAYSFKCRNEDENKNKIKGISKSQSKHIKFEEYYNCLFGNEYQKECNNYIIRSINHEMLLQEVKKSTLSIFDDKRCYLNNIESKPWN